MELPERRLVLLFVMVSGLVGLYILSYSRQIQVPWHMVTLARLTTIIDAHRSLERYDPRPPGSSSQDGAVQGGDDSTTPTSEAPLGATEDSSLPPKPPKPPTTTTTTTKAAATTTPLRTTTPDFIGDRYTSEDVPLQSSCPDSIRSRVSNSSFAGRFLSRLPVLQWSKHATEAEYQRLRRYRGTFGWGEETFPMLKASLSVLNTSANRVMFDDWERRANRSQCIRCAVVGNGGILKDSKKGTEIDQHDYVFRTNGAVIGGFEQDVGTRTSLYTFSTNTLRNSMYNYHGVGFNGPPLGEETRYVFLPTSDRDYILMRASAMHTPIDTGPEKTKTPPKYFGENVSVEKFKMYHPDFVRYLRNRFLRSSLLKGPYKNIYRPSTGAVMLLAAIHTCDQVSAYGFMTPDYKNYSTHYYDKTYQAVIFYANHDFRMEMDLWQELRREGLLNLYMRQ